MHFSQLMKSNTYFFIFTVLVAADSDMRLSDCLQGAHLTGARELTGDSEIINPEGLAGREAE